MIIDASANVAVLQDLLYRPSCSLAKDLQRGEGTVEMVKGFLKYVLSKRKEVKSVEFTDDSTKMIAGKRHLLPDFRFYRDGKTWYQYHMDAVPYGQETKNIMKAHTKLKENGHHPGTDFTNDGLDIWLQSFNNECLRPIYGTHWEIRRESIMAYDVTVKGHMGIPDSMSGGSQLTKSKKMVTTKWWFGYIF